MKKIMIFGGIGLVVVIIGVVAAIFLLGGEKEPEPISYLEFPLGEQYTNISQPEGETTARKTVLKYSPVIQYTNADLTEVFPTKQTVLLNEIRKYFMSRTAEQLGRLDRVQEDLTEMAIEIMESDSDSITNVFFLEFIIQ